MKLTNQYGTIRISHDVIATIAGLSAMECFGVKGMAMRSVGDGMAYLLRRESLTKGVKVRCFDNGIEIDLHIVVEHGVNIASVTSSIMNTVRYTVQQMTSVKVKNVNVFVDSIMSSK